MATTQEPTFIAKVRNPYTKLYEPLVHLTDEPDASFDISKGVAATPKAVAAVTNKVNQEIEPKLNKKLDKESLTPQSVAGEVSFDKTIKGKIESANTADTLTTERKFVLQLGPEGEQVVQNFNGSKSCDLSPTSIDASIVKTGLLPNRVLPLVSIDACGAVPQGNDKSTSFLNGQGQWGEVTPELIGALSVNTKELQTIKSSLLPASNNELTLGSSDFSWNSVYAQTFNGNLTGTANGLNKTLNFYGCVNNLKINLSSTNLTDVLTNIQLDLANECVQNKHIVDKSINISKLDNSIGTTIVSPNEPVDEHVKIWVKI